MAFGKLSPTPSPIRIKIVQQFLQSFISGLGRGFNATYFQVCGGLLRGRSGSLNSDHYPMPYVEGVTCTYQIRLDNGLDGKITFDTPLAIDSATQERGLIALFYIFSVRELSRGSLYLNESAVTG